MLRRAALSISSALLLSLPVAGESLLVGDPDLHFVRLGAAHSSGLAATGVTPSQVLDYGSFQWLAVSSSERATLESSGLANDIKVASFVLDLGGSKFDPLADTPVIAEGWSLAAERVPSDDLHLVQWIGPSRQEWLDQLQASGLEVVQYIHPFTYVVWGQPQAQTLRSFGAAVRWSAPFQPAYRVLPRWQDLDAEALPTDALVYRGADLDQVVRQLQALGAGNISRASIDNRFEELSFTLAGDRLRQAAHIPGIYTLQPIPTDGGLRSEMSNQVNVNNIDGSNLALTGYLAWLADKGLDGTGVVMANVDSGINESHPDLVGRMLPCTGSTCGGGISSSHGTHTAGIMVGDGASGTADANGFLRGLGMAPGAQLVEQRYSGTFTLPGGMLTLMRQSHQNGAVLSGNSWGPAGSPRGYDNDTMQVDIGVRDADDTQAGNQLFTYVLSFMNGNGGTSTQGSPDEAKNLFNIGSTKMRIGTTTQSLDINDLSANSAHGPALDGRTIPHMVAPGCSVDSTDTGGGGYGLKCGTSMASPHVAGAAGLFFQYYRGRFGTDPGPALVKAAFLAVTHNLEGFRDADGGTLGHPFDSKQGWGRMDAEAVLDPQFEVTYWDRPAVLDGTGETWTAELTAADPSEPVRVMLVWTDAPGHGLGGSTPAWNNDLDLVVEVDGSTYLGNVFGSDGLSTTGGSRDDRNNTEGVFLASAAGTLTLRVEATNLSSDGIPGEGDATDQDFALVCYNCRSEAGAIFADGFEDGTANAWTIVQ